MDKIYKKPSNFINSKNKNEDKSNFEKLLNEIDAIKKEDNLDYNETIKSTLIQLNAILGDHINDGLENYNQMCWYELETRLLQIVYVLQLLYSSENPKASMLSIDEDNPDFTALAWLAAENGNCTNIYLFLSTHYKIDHTAQIGQNGTTIVHEAALSGDLNFLKLVLKNVSFDTVNLMDKRGYTALHLVAYYGRSYQDYEKLVALVENGADPLLKTKSGKDFWMLCCKNAETKKVFLSALLEGDCEKIDPILISYGGVLSCIDEGFLKDNITQESYYLAKLTTHFHLFKILLDKGSSNRSPFIQEKMIEYLIRYASELDDGSNEKMVLSIATIIKSVNETGSSKFDHTRTFFNNELPGHSRYVTIINNKSLTEYNVIVLDGGGGAVEIKEQIENNHNGVTCDDQNLLNDKNLIKKQKSFYSYGITHLKASGDIKKVKKEIQKAIDNNGKIEDALKSKFIKNLLFKKQKDGSCAGFSLLLGIAYLFAELSLNKEGYTWENCTDFAEKLKERLAENKLFDDFEKKLHIYMATDEGLGFSGLNWDAIKKDYPERYNYLVEQIITCFEELCERGEVEAVYELLTDLPFETILMELMEHNFLFNTLLNHKQGSVIAQLIENTDKELLKLKKDNRKLYQFFLFNLSKGLNYLVKKNDQKTISLIINSIESNEVLADLLDPEYASDDKKDVFSKNQTRIFYEVINEEKNFSQLKEDNPDRYYSLIGIGSKYMEKLNNDPENEELKKLRTLFESKGILKDINDYLLFCYAIHFSAMTLIGNGVLSSNDEMKNNDRN